jgi:hypothetical protein
MEKQSTPLGVKTIESARDEQTLRSSASPDATKDEVREVTNACSGPLRACKD